MTTSKITSKDSKALLLTCSSTFTGFVDLNRLQGAASIAMQMKPSYSAAERLNLNPRVLSLNIDKPEILEEIGNPSICIIHKINSNNTAIVKGFSMAILSAVACLKARGCKIVVFYSDNLACLDEIRGTLHRDILKLADHIVVPSQAMKQLSKPFINQNTEITIIEDPWQTKSQAYPSFKDGEVLHLAWFGNNANAPYLCNLLPSLLKGVNRYHAIKLSILSNQASIDQVKNTFIACKKMATKNWNIDFHLWDTFDQPNQLENVLGPAHVALLPSNPLDQLKKGVGHNRMVDAIRSGCVVIASPMQSYIELSKIALISDDLVKILNQINNQLPRLSEKHGSNRTALLERFNPKENARKWEKLITQMLSQNNST